MRPFMFVLSHVTAATSASMTTVSIETLFSANYDFVWRSLRRLGVTPADVDDAAQETFLVARRQIANIQAGRERAYLFGVAIRIAGTHRRTVRRRRLVDAPMAIATQPSHESPSHETETNQTRALLDQVIAEIDDDVRPIFVLAELEELTMAAIAEMLDMPAGTVASRLRRAREQFAAAARRMREEHL